MATRTTAQPRVFVRRSSGLIREFGLMDVVIINTIGANAPTSALLGLTAVAALWPGTNLALLVVFGGIVSLATVLTYGLMSAAMPRAGGDYVFVGRSLWPWLGFLANWMMTISLFVLFGIICISTVTLGLGPSLTALGYVTGNAGLVSAATTITTNTTALILIALVILVVPIAIALLGDRWVKQAFRVFTVVGAVGALLALVVLLVNDYNGATARLNAVLQSHHDGTLQAMRAAADRAGFHPVPFSLGATFSALPFGFLLYVGLTYTTYLGGEIQRPQRSQPLGMAITLALTGLYLVLFFALGYRALGWDNIHAWAYLMNNKPAALTFPGGTPYASLLAGVLTSNGVVSFLIGLSFLAWYLMLLLFAVIMAARNLFAWSMDRILPEAVAAVNSRGTPWVATLIVGIAAIGIAFVAVYTSIINLFVNYTLLYATTFLLAGIGAAAFPYRRPDLFDNAPDVTRRRIFGVPIITLAGIAQTILFAYIIIVSIQVPAFSGPIGTAALGFIVGLIILGPVVFFVSRAIRKAQGIDMDATWRTLPPD